MTSLWWWLRGRRAEVGPGDVPLGYAKDQVPMLVVLAGLLAVEAAVVGLLVPWWWVLVLAKPVAGVGRVRFRADDPRAAHTALTSALIRA